MNLLYDKTDGRQLTGLHMKSLGDELGWTEAETEGVVEYLSDAADIPALRAILASPAIDYSEGLRIRTMRGPTIGPTRLPVTRSSVT